MHRRRKGVPAQRRNIKLARAAKKPTVEPSASQRERNGRRSIGEAAFLVPLAALISIVAGFWAWNFAAKEFRPAPRLPSPGTIVVATQPSSAAVDAVQVSASYGSSADKARASVQIAINQLPESAPRVGPPAKLYVLLCGSIAQGPKYVDNRGAPIAWATLKLDQGDIQSSLFGRASECVYTTLELPPDGLRQALLRGSSGRPIDSLSGDRVLYAVPGVVAMPARFPLGDISPGPLPAGSTLTVDLDGVPGDIENVMASPELPDSGRLEWKSILGADNAREYRLSGDLHDLVAAGQRNLFIAGALVGVAGGGLVWLFELTASLLLKALRPRPGTELSKGSVEGPVVSDA
ncbi:hypothetical protein AB0I37_29535 [Micromonospora purpureochromogenes]|uniref:hypothetical protein n=1 Tax=Micromonospora purpureochromogenes TaxID=47872 RepID=UPI0033EB1AF6